MTASIALIVSMVRAANQGKHIPVPQVACAVLALLIGFSFMPFGIRMLAYQGNGRIKNWRWVLAVNGVASLVLLSAVAAGVKIYE
ncbi:MAG: hypothetical protein HKP61_09650 [Dactylosporangium sp.]|nr:hypothetical protein [Dactylosporangium sp.]NNJ61196.1 hypothetical protein [Dactylosporangium sp.]